MLPAIAPRDAVVQIGSCRHFCKEGQPLQPRKPLELLMDQKRQIGAAAFAAQYLQDPAPETGNLLKLDWLKWCELHPVRQSSDQIVQSWDTAVKVKATSDYSACLTFLVRNNNEYYLIDAWRKKVEFFELCATVRSLAKKYAPNIEDQASGSPLVSECSRNGMTGVSNANSLFNGTGNYFGGTGNLGAGTGILLIKNQNRRG